MASVEGEDGWTSFSAVVATTHPVPKYGGFQLSDENLEQIATALNSGKLPMIGHHDWSKPVRTRNVVASVVELEDGHKAVRLESEVVAEDLEALGEIRGMSFTTFELLGRAEGPHSDQPALQLSADAAAFSETDIAAASEVMCQLAPVDARLLFQFNAVETARMVVELGYDLVNALGPNLAASAIWDGIRYLFTRRQHLPDARAATRIELVTPLPEGREVIGLIDTEDSDVARLALETYARSVEIAAAAVELRTVVQWKALEQKWDNDTTDNDNSSS